MPASRTAKSPACEDGKRSATKSSKLPVKPGLAGPARPRGVRARDGGVEETDLREVGGKPLDLDQERGRLAVEGAADDLDLDVGPLALAQVADLVGAVLGRREQHAVIARAAVVAAVVDVGVEAVLVGPEVDHPHAHLLRGAERGGDVGPAGRRRRRRGGEGRLVVEARRVIELETERPDELREVGRRDVVRRHAATREERAEVDGRAVDGAAAAAGPLDLGDLLAAALGRLGKRLGLEHARVEGGGAAGMGRRLRERVAVLVEGVVGRAVHGRPCAGAEREPAGAGIRRCLRHQAVVRRSRSVLEQLAEAGRHALVGVLLDRLLHQAVGGEEEELVLAPIIVMARAMRLGCLCADPRDEARGDHSGGQ